MIGAERAADMSASRQRCQGDGLAKETYVSTSGPREARRVIRSHRMLTT
jgi:hypothetical protein